MNDLHKHFTAKVLRKDFTDTERLLWKYLRAKQMEGCKFRRQEPIGSYIVDFVCQEKRIIIEVDGGQHSVEREKDNRRDTWFEGQGYKVLRFWDNKVLTNIKGILEVMRDYLNHPPQPPPSYCLTDLPSREGKFVDILTGRHEEPL